MEVANFSFGGNVILSKSSSFAKKGIISMVKNLTMATVQSIQCISCNSSMLSFFLWFVAAFQFSIHHN